MNRFCWSLSELSSLMNDGTWSRLKKTMRSCVYVYVPKKAMCGTPVCAHMQSVALVCKALPVRGEMGWGRWMGGRFTLLLSLCSLPVCLNLPTTTHPLITCYCLLPHSFTYLFSSFHLSSPLPSIPFYFTAASPFPNSHLTLIFTFSLSSLALPQQCNNAHTNYKFHH